MEITRMRVPHHYSSVQISKLTRMMRQLVVAVMANVKVDIIKFENLGEMSLPSYATAGSAGMNLIAALRPGETRTMKPMQRMLIDTVSLFLYPKVTRLR
jgi:hypothetical protein